MKYLFCCGRSYLPETIGGIQVNTDALCRALLRRGHSVVVLAGRERRTLGERLRDAADRVRSRLPPPDRSLGYPVYRLFHPESLIGRLLELERPDRVVVQSQHMLRYAQAARRVGISTHAYFHATCDYDLEAVGELPFASVITNSRYTASWAKARFGVEPTVIRPLVDPERFRVTTRGGRVLYVNPHPAKGGRLALDIASRLPDIHFDFVECWFRNDAVAEVRRRASQLPNVTWHGPMPDLRPLLAEARLLIMPSQSSEGWGRVASEAQVSGIPVVATSIGGLPEAVGPGGILLGADDPVEAWVGAIRRLYDDEISYRDLSRLAEQHARREEISPQRVVGDLLSTTGGAVSP